MTKEERESLTETNRRLKQELADLKLKNEEQRLKQQIEFAKAEAKRYGTQSKPKAPANKAAAMQKEYLKKQYQNEAKSCKEISTAIMVGTFALLETICLSLDGGILLAFLLLPLNGLLAIAAYAITATIIAHDGKLLMKEGIDVHKEVNACTAQANGAVLTGIGVGIVTGHKANQARKEISDPDHWTKA